MTTLRPFSPGGPVSAAALGAWGPVVLLMGPPGSAKTSLFIIKAMAGTWMQNKYPDGVRRARLWVLAIDYRRLWGNLIPSFFEWIPQHDPDNGVVWVGPRGGPALQTISMQNPQGEIAILEILFEAVRALLNTPRFKQFFDEQNIEGLGDPAAFHGNDKEDPDDAHWMDRFAKAAGLVGRMAPRPAPTNLLTPRLQAVRDTLVIEEGVPRALFDPEHCAPLRRAYNGAYRFRQLRIVGDVRYDPEPDKNDASHVADADQYLSLGQGGYEKAIGRDRAREGNGVLELMRRQGLLVDPRMGHNGGPALDEPRGPMRPMIIPR